MGTDTTKQDPPKKGGGVIGMIVLIIAGYALYQAVKIFLL